jgi:hypothetical protein
MDENTDYVSNRGDKLCNYYIAIIGQDEEAMANIDWNYIMEEWTLWRQLYEYCPIQNKDANVFYYGTYYNWLKSHPGPQIALHQQR